MYLYIGKVQVGPLSGYLWLLGRRLYLKLGWRPSDTYFLGNLSDPLSLAVRLRRLIPRPVDVRRAAVQLAKALAAALYLARRCRDSPRWKIRTWEAEAAFPSSSERMSSQNARRRYEGRRSWASPTVEICGTRRLGGA